MRLQPNHVNKSSYENKNNDGKKRKKLSELGRNAKKNLLNNSDETVYKDLLICKKANIRQGLYTNRPFVEKYAESVSTSLLRNVYNEVVKIQDLVI
jgi:hypothetical protein